MRPLDRRNFLWNAGAMLGAATLRPPFSLAQEMTQPQRGSNRAGSRIEPFPMTHVRLGPGPMLTMQQRNAVFLLSLPNDRLLHMFRVSAGLPSAAQPLGGWEAPACELRGHFAGGHILSACALMYASTGDSRFQDKANLLVAEMAKCQRSDGYLSAFPASFFERLRNGQKVWAPFYTYHKIMAGHLDVYTHCGNKLALHTAQRMADWTGAYVTPIPEAHFQQMLNVEYGGMQESLFNLYAITGERRYADLARKFSHSDFFNPLVNKQDDLAGLHANTHIPQVIGAARGYEVTGDPQFHAIAENFWNFLTAQHVYATGGTSDDEFWHKPGTLASHLGPDAQECCCSYNMMKLSRHLLRWSADPQLADQYERMLWNVRLGTQDEAGMLMYYVSLTPGLFRTFGTEFDSFWCCTGTGAEEYSKANDSIYYRSPGALYISQFLGSTLQWPEKGLRLTQETGFPREEQTRLTFALDRPMRTALMVRIPYWAGLGTQIRINGRKHPMTLQPGTYARVDRTWRNGDAVVVDLPMQLHMAPLPNAPQVQAAMYGPLVLAGVISDDTVLPQAMYGHTGPHAARQDRVPLPVVRTKNKESAGWLRRQNSPGLVFETVSAQPVTLRPLADIYNQRYTVYWQVQPDA